jgi:hypothetical protein
MRQYNFIPGAHFRTYAWDPVWGPIVLKPPPLRTRPPPPQSTVILTVLRKSGGSFSAAGSSLLPAGAAGVLSIIGQGGAGEGWRFPLAGIVESFGWNARPAKKKKEK